MHSSQARLSTLAPAPPSTRAAAEDDAQPKNEAEVIPVAAVVQLVDVHLVRKQGNDKRDDRNETMPQSTPESGHIAICIGDINRRIRSRRTTRKQEQAQNGQYGNKSSSIPHDLPPLQRYLTHRRVDVVLMFPYTPLDPIHDIVVHNTTDRVHRTTAVCSIYGRFGSQQVSAQLMSSRGEP